MGKMQNGSCETTVIGPQVRPCDRRYSAVYRTPCVAGAAVNCVMRMWKVAFCACYRNLNLPSQEQWSAMCHTVFLFRILHVIFKCSQWSAEVECDLVLISSTAASLNCFKSSLI